MKTPALLSARWLKAAVFAVALLLVLGGGGLAWVTVASNRLLSREVDTHSIDVLLVPFPLDEREAASSAPDEPETASRALHRAVERGRHLVESRYACAECHGEDFGGGVMVDAPPIGRFLGPNLTSGKGGVTSAYRAADWDRIVRHGVKPDGRPALMPSEDYALMSDQELSDVIAYISSQPPVDSEVPPSTLGPLGRFLIATGQMPLSAHLMESHAREHPRFPPAADASVDFGRHLAGTCVGCHGHDLSGGPIAGGDPSWVPASNLTPHSDGLGDWSYDAFVTAMREGRRPDGTVVRPPMTVVLPYAQRMTDVEVQALWAYLRSVPAAATSK